MTDRRLSVPRLVPGTPHELIVFDQPHACPYLQGRTARLPLRLPTRALQPSELDARLRHGDRRQGFVLYRTACPSCSACRPIRVHAHTFQPSRSQRRAYRRAEAALRVRIASPCVDEQHVRLYNLHKLKRQLSDKQPPIDFKSYWDFLVSSCCASFELQYYLGQQLVGVAVTDQSAHALSAVYCYYDPALAHLSIGTYSIMKQLQLCRDRSLSHLYLGLYIADCRAMSYKASFRPHEYLTDGRWITAD